MPIFIALFTILSSVGKWIFELVLMYGKKIAFLTIVIGMFFASLYVISTAVFATIGSIRGSAAFANIAQYTSLLRAVFPSNFFAIAALLMAIEFQVFFFRWGLKVLDIKVHFFGS